MARDGDWALGSSGSRVTSADTPTAGPVWGPASRKPNAFVPLCVLMLVWEGVVCGPRVNHFLLSFLCGFGSQHAFECCLSI